ncbi:MAG: hypothetical protein ABIQ39_07055 [Ilumatobacteraceae bacterium]
MASTSTSFAGTPNSPKVVVVVGAMCAKWTIGVAGAVKIGAT